MLQSQYKCTAQPLYCMQQHTSHTLGEDLSIHAFFHLCMRFQGLPNVGGCAVFSSCNCFDGYFAQESDFIITITIIICIGPG